MKPFEDVLLTADYDRTLTGPDGTVPQRNIEAIRYFTENGGSFTVNTGRSAVLSKAMMEEIPANVPFLLMNGSLTYYKGEVIDLHPIDLEPWDVLNLLLNEYPQVHLAVQGLKTHYLLNPTDVDIALYEKRGWSYTLVKPGDDVGVFAKFNVQAKGKLPTDQSRELGADAGRLYDEITERIESLWGDKLVVFRSGVQLLNVHAKGVSKAKAARALQARLGKKLLVCVGDAGNDIPMLDGADYAYCPADGVVANRYETVCNCGDGAVADVIYKKIPKILGFQP